MRRLDVRTPDLDLETPGLVVSGVLLEVVEWAHGEGVGDDEIRRRLDEVLTHEGGTTDVSARS